MSRAPTVDLHWSMMIINLDRQHSIGVSVDIVSTNDSQWSPPFLKKVLERCYLTNIQRNGNRAFGKWCYDPGGALKLIMLTYTSKKRGKGYFFKHCRRSPRLCLGYEFHEILKKRYTFQQSHIDEFQRHKILL